MKRLWIYLALSVLAAALAIWLWWSNFTLQITEYKINDPGIPAAFSGYRIVQISDLHNCQYGKGNVRLIREISRQKPDIIVITGDLIDSRMTNVEIALDFVREAAKIAPVYYISGNHEALLKNYDDIRLELARLGVTVLENQKTVLQRNRSYITLVGLTDPSFTNYYEEKQRWDITDSALTDLCSPEDGYSILLSHRPELFDIYAKHGCRLVLTGHAHGGQVRLPWIGGLFAPGQGFFPQYDAGIFKEGQTSMVVSRGVGGKVILPRVNNRPEIVVVELMQK